MKSKLKLRKTHYLVDVENDSLRLTSQRMKSRNKAKVIEEIQLKEFISRKLKGNLLWRPSCCHVWKWLILRPDYFVARPAKQIC